MPLMHNETTSTVAYIFYVTVATCQLRVFVYNGAKYTMHLHLD